MASILFSIFSTINEVYIIQERIRESSVFYTPFSFGRWAREVHRYRVQRDIAAYLSDPSELITTKQSPTTSYKVINQSCGTRTGGVGNHLEYASSCWLQIPSTHTLIAYIPGDTICQPLYNTIIHSCRSLLFGGQHHVKCREVSESQWGEQFLYK